MYYESLGRSHVYNGNSNHVFHEFGEWPNFNVFQADFVEEFARRVTAARVFTEVF